jgi:hypothetical protein
VTQDLAGLGIDSVNALTSQTSDDAIIVLVDIIGIVIDPALNVLSCDGALENERAHKIPAQKKRGGRGFIPGASRLKFSARFQARRSF